MSNFLVIGAMKCGTTSLYEYLRAHHQLDMISVKELNFYNNETNWERGRSWYESHFNNTGALRGDVNPNYAMYPLCRNVPQRLHSLYPSCKLIYLVRDPVSRFISHVQHNRAAGYDDRELEQIFADLSSGVDAYNYLGNSKYYLQLSRFLEFFPLHQIMVVSSQRLRVTREAVLQEMTTFLEVDPFNSMDACSHMTHESDRKRRLPAWLRDSFQHPWLGGLAGSTVRLVKGIVPENVYNQVRNVLTSPVKKVELNSEQRQLVQSWIAEDLDSLQQAFGIMNL